MSPTLPSRAQAKPNQAKNAVRKEASPRPDSDVLTSSIKFILKPPRSGLGCVIMRHVWAVFGHKGESR